MTVGRKSLIPLLLLLPCLYILSAYTTWDPLHRYFCVTPSCHEPDNYSELNTRKKIIWNQRLKSYQVTHQMITVPEDGSLIQLGEDDLFTAGGSKNLLELTYQNNGAGKQLLVRNSSRNNTIFFDNNSSHKKTYIPELKLSQGMEININGNLLTFKEVTKEEVQLQIHYVDLQHQKNGNKEEIIEFTIIKNNHKENTSKLVMKDIGIDKSECSGKYCGNVYLGGNLVNKFRLPIPNIQPRAFVIEYRHNWGFVFRPVQGNISLLDKYNVKLIDKKKNSVSVKNYWLNLSEFVGENRFGLKVGYTRYEGYIRGNQIIFDTILRPSKMSKQTQQSTNQTVVIEQKPLVTSGIWGGIVAIFMALLGYLLANSSSEYHAYQDMKKHTKRLYMYLGLSFLIPLFGQVYCLRAVCQRYRYTNERYSRDSDWDYGLYLTLVFFSPLISFYVWLMLDKLSGLKWLAWLTNILSASDIAIYCLITLFLHLYIAINSFKVKLSAFWVISLWLLLFGIDYGLSLNFASYDTKYFYDFKGQLLLVTLFLQIVLIYFGGFYFSKTKRYFDFKALSLSVGDALSRLLDYAGTSKPKVHNKIPIINKIPINILELVLLIAFIAMIAVQWSVGDETGMGGFQPNELVKLLLGLLLAAVLERKLEYVNKKVKNKNMLAMMALLFFIAILLCYLYPHDIILNILFSLFLFLLLTDVKRHYNRRSFWSLILLCAFIAVMAVVVHDFSYIIIVFYPMIFYLTYKLVDNFNKGKKTVNKTILVAVTFVLLLTGWFLINMSFEHELSRHLFEVIEKFESYQARMQAQENPLHYSETAYQTIKSSQLASSETGFVDMASLSQVDDDFALSGWLYGYNAFSLMFKLLGYAIFGVLAMWLLCACVLMAEARDYRSQQNEKMLQTYFWLDYFILWGAGVTIIHALIATSTNLNLLPIMGQPFPFLGRQGSYLILFQLPFIFLVILFFLSQKDIDEMESNEAIV